MQLKNFISDLSFIITDLETSRTTKAEINLFMKILRGLKKRMSLNEKKIYKKIINEFNNRLNKIKTIDKEIAFKMADLKNEIEMYKALEKMKKEDKLK